VGLMILAFCPGGTSSNLMTFFVKGDLALSISLTAVVSLFAPFTIPFLANLTMNHFLGEGSEFVLPVQQTIFTLSALTILPVGLGMILRKWESVFFHTVENPAKVFSIIFLLLIIVGITKNNQDNMVSYLQQVGLPVLVLNVLALVLGLVVALLVRLNREQSITISYEVGMQNGTAALLVTGTILQNNVMTISSAVYSLVMFLGGGVFVLDLKALFMKDKFSAV